MSAEWRWNGPEAAPDFVMLPRQVARTIICHLRASESKLLYALLDSAYGTGTDEVSASYSWLQERCGLARSTVARGMAQLRELGLIAITEGQENGCHDAYRYRILVTLDRRYVARNGGGSSSKNATGSSSETLPDPVAKRYRIGGSVPLSIYRREVEDRAHTRTEKFYRGRYAMCERCGSRPCVCEG